MTQLAGTHREEAITPHELTLNRSLNPVVPINPATAVDSISGLSNFVFHRRTFLKRKWLGFAS